MAAWSRRRTRTGTCLLLHVGLEVEGGGCAWGRGDAKGGATPGRGEEGPPAGVVAARARGGAGRA